MEKQPTNIRRKHMIKTVIFDIGNVLVKFDWRSYAESLFDKETARIVTEALWKDGYWEEFDRGVLPFEEIVGLMENAAPEYKTEIRTALATAGKSLHQYAYAIPWIRELKTQGYQVLFLSNYSEFLMEQNPEALNFLPHMDGGLFSCHAKVIKPNREIYAMLCEKYALDPAEAIFIDDNAANIEAAKQFGLHAVRFEGYEKNYGEIMKYLAEYGIKSIESGENNE